MAVEEGKSIVGTNTVVLFAGWEAVLDAVVRR